MNLAAFLLAAAALALTPGADMLYVATRTAAGGFHAGLASSLGIAVGAMCHTAAAAAGISAVFIRYPRMFSVFVWVGAAYLTYLGIQTMLPPPARSATAAREARLWRVFGQGVAVNALNPKVGLFFLGFLPQFVDPARGSVALQMLVLGTVFNVLGTSVNVAVAAGAGSIGRRVSRGAVAPRWHRRVAGAVLIGLGILMAGANLR